MNLCGRLLAKKGVPVEEAVATRALLISGSPLAGDIRRLMRQLEKAGVNTEDVRFVCDINQRIKCGLSPGLCITSQDVWTDAAADLRLYEGQYQLRKRRKAHFAGWGVGEEMDLLEVEYSSVEMTLRRIHEATLRAMSEARVVVVIATVLLPEITGMLERMKGGAKPKILLYRRAKIWAAEPSKDSKSDAENIVRRFSSMANKLSERLYVVQARRGAEKICSLIGRSRFLLITEARPDSTYWPPIAHFLGEAKSVGLCVPTLASSWATVKQVRNLGHRPFTMRLPLFGYANPVTEDRIAKFMSSAINFSQMDGISPPEYAALIWLASPRRRIDLSIAHECVSLLERVFRRSLVGTLLLQPHWSPLAQWATIVAHRVGMRVISAPTMTIAGNHASIVGWENVDIIPAYGQQCVNAFAALGYDRSRLPVIGNVSMDKLVILQRDEVIRVLEDNFNVILPREKHIILVATSHIDTNETQWVQALIDCCKLRGDAFVLYKIHPSFRAIAAELRQKFSGEHCVVSENAPIDLAIGSASIVITDYSSTGAQAVIAGRLLLVVNTSGKPYPANDYVGLSIAKLVARAEEFGPTLSALLDEGWTPSREMTDKFLADYNGPNDGKAARRLVELLSQYSRPSTGRSEVMPDAT